MSTPSSAGTNPQAPSDTTLALYDDRQQVVLRCAIELWASASTGVEWRRRDEVLKNKRKVIQSLLQLDDEEPCES